MTETEKQFDDPYVLQQLTDAYLDNTSSKFTKLLGDSYINEYFNRLKTATPQYADKWSEWLKSAPGLQFSDWATHAGEFLSLLTVRKRFWENTYQTSMENWLKNNPEYLPTKIKGMKQATIWLKFNRITLWLSFFLLTIFIIPTVTHFTPISLPTGLITAFLFFLTGVSSLTWSLKYKKKYNIHKTSEEKRILTSIALFGAYPVVGDENNIILPSPPYGWAEDKDDVLKWKEVNDFLVQKYVNPHNENSFPLLVLPNTNPANIPVESLRLLKTVYQKTDDLGLVE